MVHEDEGKNWKYVTTSQEILKIFECHHKLQEKHKIDSPSESTEEPTLETL